MANSTTFEVSVDKDLNLLPGGRKSGSVGRYSEDREEYHLTPQDGNIQSDVLLLNGTPLKLTEDLDIPAMNLKLVNAFEPIRVAPDSFVFVTFKGFRAPACCW